MLTEKNAIKIDSEKNPLNEKARIKIKQKNFKKGKNKKKALKRFKMEKTVDDTIKNINILLQNEVNYIFLYFYFNIFIIVSRFR